MMTKLYHREVYWKPSFDKGVAELVQSVDNLSNHMWNHIDNTDEKHEIDVVKLYLAIQKLKAQDTVEAFEIELDDWIVTKAVVRTEYDDMHDISIVFRFGKIVTAWINRKDDKHYTLDVDKYEKG